MAADDQALVEGREAFDRFDWQAASDAFARAEQSLELIDVRERIVGIPGKLGPGARSGCCEAVAKAICSGNKVACLECRTQYTLTMRSP